MRTIGKRTQYRVTATPSAEALKAGAVHQATAQALAAIATTGIRRGIYRFATHAEANAHADEGVVRAIVANRQARNPPR